MLVYFKIIYVILYYHCIAAYKELVHTWLKSTCKKYTKHQMSNCSPCPRVPQSPLLNKNYYPSNKMLLLNHNLFIYFQEIFHKNIETIHLYHLSQYQKYLLTYSHCGPILFKMVLECRYFWDIFVLQQIFHLFLYFAGQRLK